MKAMKTASIVSGTVLFLYVLLLIAQIWTEAVSWEIFIKITLTALVIVVTVFGLAMLYREYVEEKTMKEKNYID